MEQKLSSDAQNFSSSSTIYDQIGLKYQDSFGHNAGRDEIVGRFLDLLPSNSQVLDCGCGTGKPVAHMIVTRGHRVCGIDISQTMVDLSRQQVPNGSFERVNMLEYEAPTNSFHGIVASLSLFYFERDELTSMASKWFQWLQPGGLLLLVVLGAEDSSSTTAEMYDSDGECARRVPDIFMGLNQTINLFTKQGWNNLVTKAGFELVSTERMPSIPLAESGGDDGKYYFVVARKPATA
ncbi:hypothetical protein MMC22_004960 [Lobaria immixta]|nr:hypothetical protein [Lobaria immixta]